MTVFITGATGFLGSYVVDHLLRETDVELALLTRARDRAEGVEKLWKALQLHMDAESFYGFLPRVRFVPGDVTGERLGMSEADHDFVVKNAESVLHIAASLNRKSAKACFNNNLRGTLSVIQLARAIADDHGLRRFSFVSTAAVAGTRQGEDLDEDHVIDWNRSDYDPYGRTKKFCEHMIHELLPDVQKTLFRPTIVVGDSRFAETTQFDMIRAICFLADMPIVPIDGKGRVDVVNADWVGRAIAIIHMKPEPKYDTYHLSSGRASPTAEEMGEVIKGYVGKRPPRFAPRLEGPFASLMDTLGGMKSRNLVTQVGSLFKVFMPYITYDTIFLNDRAVEEVGAAPAPWSEYGGRLCEYVERVGFEYPYAPLPPAPAKAPEPRVADREGAA